MALWADAPVGWAARPRKNQKPATVATTTTATVETSSHVFFGAEPVGDASLTCSSATAARDAEPEVLAAGAGADSIGGDAITDEEAGGAASMIALLPDSVSRLSLCTSVRMSAACW